MKPKEPVVLVGIGKHNLRELLDQALTSLEGEKTLLEAFDVHHWPPRYRAASSCSEQEIETFGEYVNWVLEKLKTED